ncbi:MAG: hypothetical protein JWP38_3412 [Herbaspirillum sp.]|jgi:ElaB/YqjD/DUF883 family membrane-anchored ribosome-binding protein|nr:hypothetical protein [Herbaspirillum sp.]
MEQENLKTVRNDVGTLLNEAQDLFREAATATALKADELRTRGMALLEDAATQAQAMRSTVVASGKELVANTDEYVNRNPWRAVAISTAVGLIAGLAVARSCGR